MKELERKKIGVTIVSIYFIEYSEYPLRQFSMRIKVTSSISWLQTTNPANIFLQYGVLSVFSLRSSIGFSLQTSSAQILLKLPANFFLIRQACNKAEHRSRSDQRSSASYLSHSLPKNFNIRHSLPTDLLLISQGCIYKNGGK